MASLLRFSPQCVSRGGRRKSARQTKQSNLVTLAEPEKSSSKSTTRQPQRERARREMLEKELPNDIWQSETVSKVFQALFVALCVTAVVFLLSLARPLISGTVQAFPSPPSA